MKNSRKHKSIFQKKYLIMQLIALAVLYGIIAILVESAEWFQRWWGKISFATVVYQLTTPLKGTETSLIVSYCQGVIPLVITRLVLVLGFWYVFVRIFSVLDLEVHVRLWKKHFTVKMGKCFLRCGQGLFLLLLTLLSVYEIRHEVEALGIDDYIEEVRESSTIHEDYYVIPTESIMKFPDKKRNLIFIYMESIENTYASVEDGGGKPINYIPELTQLANEHVSISNKDKIGGTYPNERSGWTIAALLGATAGVPYKIPGNELWGEASAGQYTEFLSGLTTLGDILEKQGYQNYFLCGSEGEFAGRDLYFQKHGNYKILDYNYAVQNNYIPEDYFVFWGYEDHKMYDIAKRELTKIAQNEDPFNFTMLTVDTHMPAGYLCEVCENQYPEQYENVVACASRQAGAFVEWIKKQDWYENTTVILLGDHNSMVNNFWDDIGDFQRRTYNCFINLPETVDVSNVKNRDVCTLDIFPTTLAAIGVEIEGDRLGLGTNAFSQRSTLVEEMGETEFDMQLSRYSKYYNEQFIQGLRLY